MPRPRSSDPRSTFEVVRARQALEVLGLDVGERSPEEVTDLYSRLMEAEEQQRQEGEPEGASA